MAKLRVCIIIRALEIGGAEKQSLFLAKALRNKHDLDIVVFHGESIAPKHKKFIDESNISPILLKGLYLKKLFKLYRLFKQQKYSFVFGYLPSDNLWGSVMGKLTRVGCIVGGIRNSHIDPLKHPVLKLLHKRVQHYTIFNSHFGRKTYEKHGFIPNKCIVIENCIEINGHHRSNKAPNHTIKILMVGRFVSQKDYETGIQSIARLYYVMGQKNIELGIVGYGKLEKDIEQWLKKYAVADITTIYKKPDNLYELYRLHDIYYSSSIFEGFSNTIMEAMSLGIPILVTEVGDVPYFVQNNINGIIVPPQKVDVHAQQLKRLCNDATLRDSLGEAGFKTMQENFTFEAFQQKYLKFIDAINNNVNNP